uniref:Gypsy retrotransposon integrase-like protein 1 n=1 Tax=Sphaeramia orbicularis TaxID=375764 RepID=A0A672ZPR8_9TELE
MASRKKTVRLPRTRTGLRSQQQQPQQEMAAASYDPDWESASSSEDEDKEVKPAPARVSDTEAGLMGLMRDFLAAQSRREEGLLAELQDLRVTLSQAGGAAINPSTLTTSSPRLGLPTPTPRQRHLRASAEALSLQQPHANSSLEQPRPECRPQAEPKIPPYQLGEDIENYLLRFERIARTWRWPEDEWACRLVPLLSGKALEAYSAMDEEKAHCYRDLKAALLVKFDISPETYRQQFRSLSVPPGENPTETYHRLRGLYRRWIRPEQHSKEEIGEAIILEQLLRVLPAEMRTWVKEHDPTDGHQAAKLALQYLNARRGGPATRPISAVQRSTFQPSQPKPARRETTHQEPPGISGSAPNQLGAGKELVCYYCRQAGHKASLCPLRRAKLTGACYAPRPEVTDSTVGLQRYKVVTVNGAQATALLDSGSFMSLVRQDLVPLNVIDYSRQEDVVCVHGDKHPYPTTEVTLTIDEQPYLLTVGVVKDLPVAAVLGWDLPTLLDLLVNQPDETVCEKTKECENNMSCPVVTRAQAKAGVQLLSNGDSGVCDRDIQEPIPSPRKSRRQRRFEKQLRSAEPKMTGSLGNNVWSVPENVAELQRDDNTLKQLFMNVINEKKTSWLGKDQFIVDNGVLYALSDDRKRLVVPASCRTLVMHLGHTLPWAGHLGRHKTYLRISSRFYWPSMYKDIQQYCATCPICQKTCTVRKSDRAFLLPLPVISTPFRRIAMDIVGPLVRSSSGHQYILVVCDY